MRQSLGSPTGEAEEGVMTRVVILVLRVAGGIPGPALYWISDAK
jgi:hypothetical protein